MKRFCESLRERTKRIIGFEKKKMLSLTNKELKSHEDAKVCCICKNYFIKNRFRDLNYRKVRDHFHYIGKCRGVAHSICNLKFNLPNEVPAVFHNGSKYDYHFIIKELAKEFEGQFECIVVKAKNIKTFCSHKKEGYEIDKDGNKSDKDVFLVVKII